MLDMFEVDEKMDLDFVVDLFGLVVRWSGQSNRGCFINKFSEWYCFESIFGMVLFFT